MCTNFITKNYFKTSNAKPRAIIFGSDQRPSNPKNAHWINFLNQDTGFLFGAEKYLNFGHVWPNFGPFLVGMF